MAIQIRRGDYLNFDPQKMKPGELAVVQTNDPEGDGTALYFCTTAGTVKRLASYEDMVSMLYNIGDEVLEKVEEAASVVMLSIVEAYIRSGQTPLSSTWLATESASGPVITPDEKRIYTLMNSSSPYSKGSQFKWSGSTYVKINDGGFVNVTGVKGNSESTYRTGDVNITKSDIGLGNVENKSSATIREELTKSNVTTALEIGSGTSKYFREDGSWTTPPDTKNTTGSTNTSLKIFLIGATAQLDSSQTYSHDTVYVGADGCLYSENAKVVTNMIPKYNIDISSAVGTDDGNLYKVLSDLNWTNIITT